VVTPMSGSPGNYYEILGIPPAASPEQVERAYRYHVSLYSDASLATYSLLDPAERAQAKAQVQEAYAVLNDPLRRRAYDVSQGYAEAPATPERVPNSRPPSSTLREPVTGAVLRRLREDLGIPLKEIAERSKVGVRYLQYIEADRHRDLPPRVYLRGFLQEYARALGLDPVSTVDAYLANIPKSR